MEVIICCCRYCFAFLFFFLGETIFGALMDTTKGVAGDIERRWGAGS